MDTIGKVEIPKRTPEQEREFTRLLIVARGINPEIIYNRCAQYFQCDNWLAATWMGGAPGGIDNKKVHSLRIADNGSYAIWVKDQKESEKVENEPEHKIGSDEHLDKAKITLEERLLLELKSYSDNKKHLDETEPCVCDGSYVLEAVKAKDKSKNRVSVRWMNTNAGGKMVVQSWYGKPSGAYGTREIIG